MNRQTWNALQFYESTDALRQLAKERIGFQMSLEQGLDIRSCLYQAREYYRSAQNAELVIRPLLIFYGMTNLAKAITMLLGGKTKSRLHKLSRSHGMELHFDFGVSLEGASCRIVKHGTFADFNDTVARNELIENRGVRVRPVNLLSANLVGKQLSLLDLLGCIPDLEDIFRKTFGRDCDVIPAHASQWGEDVSVAADSDEKAPTLIRSLAALGAVDEKYKGHAVRVDPATFDEVPGLWISVSEGCRYAVEGLIMADSCRVPPVSPLSMLFMGMFILGMVARYRPDAWIGFTRLGKQDRALAYVNQFVDYCDGSFAESVLKLVTG